VSDAAALARWVHRAFSGKVKLSLASGAALCHLDPGEAPDALPGAVPARRAEFSRGRQLARRALAEFGLGSAAVPRGHDGAPIWPPGIIGSITHCPGFCAVVAARQQDFQGVGIDAEPLAALPSEVIQLIVTPDEIRRLADMPAPPGGSWQLLAFSAKEAWFKCQWPLRRRFLEFHEVEVDFAPTHGCEGAFQLRPSGMAKPEPQAVGRWFVEGQVQFCMVALEANR